MSELRKDSVLAKYVAKEQYIVAIAVACFLLWSILGLPHTALIDWDEGIFALQGQWLATAGAQGKPFNFQTPPLFQIVIAALFAVVQARPFVLALVSIVFSCLSIVLVYSLGTMLYTRREGLYAVLFFMATEFFLFFSRSGLSEATFLFFFIAAVFFFFRGLTDERTGHFLLAGLFTTAALYTKYSAFPLLIVLFTIGMLNRRTINKKWFVLTIVLPVLLYAPYLLLFFYVVGFTGIAARHGSLLGVHHHQFLYYLIRFAPFLLVFTVFHTARYEKNRWDRYILVVVLIFFAVLGFYYHYFRLAYPIVPFLAILAARYAKRHNPCVIAVILMISLAFGLDTATYRTDTPRAIGAAVRQYARDQHIQYLYASVPPNIDFYIGQEIAIPENHPWYALSKKFPALAHGRTVLYPDRNELRAEEKILLVYATAYDPLDSAAAHLLQRSELLATTEFIDAPIYYKDIFNLQRMRAQLYRVYVAERETMDDALNQFWQLGFDRRFTVILVKRSGGDCSPPNKALTH